MDWVSDRPRHCRESRVRTLWILVRISISYYVRYMWLNPFVSLCVVCLDSTGFDAKAYYEQLITTSSLPTLLRRENDLLTGASPALSIIF